MLPDVADLIKTKPRIESKEPNHGDEPAIPAECFLDEKESACNSCHAQSLYKFSVILIDTEALTKPSR